MYISLKIQTGDVGFKKKMWIQTQKSFGEKMIVYSAVLQLNCRNLAQYENDFDCI